MEKNQSLEPLNYKIHLNIEPEKDDFHGWVEADFKSTQETEHIILNVDELEIQQCSLIKNGKELPCKFKKNQEEKELSIQLPEKLDNTIKLNIEYSGKYHSDLLGMYKSTYEFEGKEECMISTQLEEIYARRVFPCIDHPSKKAIFNMELVIDKDLVGISNTAIDHEEELDGGKKLVSFKPTPRMCTYLLYIGVGNLEIREREGTHLVRLITTPGKTQYGDLALDIAMESLQYCEKFTGQAHPLEKCDLIAVPDFPFGAMENWGAITFRENMLLVYPDKTSKLGIFNIASVVAHEISHFWFGNLVSPLDWKYIWLNESFASYFTYAIPNQSHPEWHSWEHFIIQYYDSSLERDGLIHTFPVELEEEGGAFITPAKVGIVYNKGATILRMMIDYLGEENFKNGVNMFMNQFKYSNANSQNYWDGLEEGSGEPIKPFADSWVHQSGYPIVSIREKDNELLFKQEHFTYLSENDDKVWFIPIRLKIFKKDGKSEGKSFNLTSKTREFPVPRDYQAIKVNLGQQGLFRVNYPPNMLEKLGVLIKNKDLSPIDRYGVENDLFALTKKGDIKVSFYLDYIESYYKNEKDYLTLLSIFSHLRYISILKESMRGTIKELGSQIIDYFFEEHGLEPKEEDEMRISILRNYLLRFGDLFEMEKIREFCVKKFERLLKNENIIPDILSSVLKVAASEHPKAKEYFVEKITNPETPQVEKSYIYQALGCFQVEEDILEGLEIMLEHIPSQSWLYTLRILGSNKEAMHLLWPWFKENLETLEKQSPFVLARTIAAIIPMGGIGYNNEMESFFKNYSDENDFHKDTIEMSLEKLKINSNFKTQR